MSATASPSDGQRRVDQPRMRAAREMSRLVMAEAAAEYSRTMLRTLRAEVRTVVRSASPFLLSTLEREGISLDAVMAEMVPGEDWPFDAQQWPRVRRPATKSGRPSLRRQLAHVAWPGSSVPPFATATLPTRDADDLVVEVIEHSLEVRVRVGTARIGTGHGILELFVLQAFPATLLAACAGRPIDQVVDLDPLNGRGWLIEEARDHSLYTDCTIFR